MSYICPICNRNKITSELDFLCGHDVGKYSLRIYTDGYVYVSMPSKDYYLVAKLHNPKRLDEKYLDMVVLLK